MSPFQLYRERSKLSATIAPVAFQTLTINNAGAIEWESEFLGRGSNLSAELGATKKVLTEKVQKVLKVLKIGLRVVLTTANRRRQVIENIAQDKVVRLG